MEFLKQGREITASDDQYITPVFVDDVAYALDTLIGKKASGIYNVGSGKEVSINLLIKLIERRMKRKLSVAYVDKEVSSLHSVAAIEKIQKDVGWRPLTGLSKGLARTVEYYQKSR